MTPTKRLWAVLDYGLAGLSQEESENANKDIVQVIEDIDTRAELFQKLVYALEDADIAFSFAIRAEPAGDSRARLMEMDEARRKLARKAKELL